MAGHEDVLSRGIRLFEEGDYEGAEACLNQVTGELGNRALALTVLGRLYLKTDRPEEAEASVRQAMAIRRTTEAYLVLGESLMRQGKWQPAETAFLEAGKRDPQNPDPLIMQGHVLAAQDRLSEAAHCYEQALLRDAQSTTARYYLAETLVRQGDLPRASTQLHYLLQREPTYVPAILLMGDMAFFREDYRQAIVEYVRALELDSLDAPVYERLGQAFSAIGEYAQALKAFETSIKEHPTYWPCYIEAARLCETGKACARPAGTTKLSPTIPSTDRTPLRRSPASTRISVSSASRRPPTTRRLSTNPIPSSHRKPSRRRPASKPVPWTRGSSCKNTSPRGPERRRAP